MRPEGEHASYQGKEGRHSSELLGGRNVGLQARLLTGNFHEPVLLTKGQLQGITEHGAGGIGQEIGRHYENASRKQRREYQQSKNLTYKTWMTSFDAYLRGVREDTEHADRKAFLEMIGIADTTTADNFYDEYLDNGSNIVKFVHDIETLATTEQIRKHADIIRALGNTFGYATSAVIEHLIHGIRNAKDHTDTFIEVASGAANVPRTLENSLLRTIEEDGAATEVPPQKPVKKPPEEGRHRLRIDVPEPPHVPVVTFSSGAQSGVPLPILEEHRVRPAMKAATRVKPVIFQEQEPVKEDLGLEQPIVVQTPPRRRGPQVSAPLPAPFRKSEPDDDLNSLTDEEVQLAMRYLSYSDINPPPYHAPSDLIEKSGLATQYVREFAAIIKEYGKPLVLEAAIDAGQLIGQILEHVDLDLSPASRSPSWYLWHAAMSRFLANNPAVRVTMRNQDRYVPYDPFLRSNNDATPEERILSTNAHEEIVDRMLGWEIYRQRRDRLALFRKLDPTKRDESDRLQALLTEEPKDDGTNTLSSYKLIEIGKLVRMSIL